MQATTLDCMRVSKWPMRRCSNGMEIEAVVHEAAKE